MHVMQASLSSITPQVHTCILQSTVHCAIHCTLQFTALGYSVTIHPSARKYSALNMGIVAIDKLFQVMQCSCTGLWHTVCTVQFTARRTAYTKSLHYLTLSRKHSSLHALCDAVQLHRLVVCNKALQRRVRF